MHYTNCTGIILAGGLNRRFGGRNKALMEIGGQTILDRILSAFTGLFPETMVVTNTPLAFLSCESLLVTDIMDLRTPLAGLHAALNYAKTPSIFVTACDTPFLSSALIEAILANIDAKSDIVVPETENGLQPLCAVYARTCLPPIEKQLRRESATTPKDTGEPRERILRQGLKILNFYDRVRVKKIPEQTLRRIDPDLLSFFNVNTPEDFARAGQILSGNLNP
jgi:molybdopterin-guanine dinucleotide biosynthesis protein A